MAAVSCEDTNQKLTFVAIVIAHVIRHKRRARFFTDTKMSMAF